MACSETSDWHVQPYHIHTGLICHIHIRSNSSYSYRVKMGHYLSLSKRFKVVKNVNVCMLIHEAVNLYDRWREVLDPVRM